MKRRLKIQRSGLQWNDFFKRRTAPKLAVYFCPALFYGPRLILDLLGENMKPLSMLNKKVDASMWGWKKQN